jgi:hypothetical protein
MSEMMEPTAPVAGDNQPPELRPSRDGGAAQSASSRGRDKRRAASEEDCLAALSQLVPLNMAGMIDVRQTNSFRGVYATILQYHQRKRGSGTSAVLDQPGLVDILRAHPELANLLEPLLSDEQIANLMSPTRDENSGGG